MTCSPQRGPVRARQRAYSEHRIVLVAVEARNHRHLPQCESQCDRPDVHSDRFRDITCERNLELINCLASTELQFFKRLYDRTPAFQRYAEGDVVAHLHFERPVPFCLRWKRRDSGPLKYLIDVNQTIVSVPVREIAQECEPTWVG